MSAPVTPTAAQAPTPAALSGQVRRVCDLLRLLAGHEVLGLSPGEIAQGLGVPPSWCSRNLPALATTGFVEQVAGVNRWRLGVAFVRIAFTVSSQLNAARQRLDETTHRYSLPMRP